MKQACVTPWQIYTSPTSAEYQMVKMLELARLPLDKIGLQSYSTSNLLHDISAFLFLNEQLVKRLLSFSETGRSTVCEISRLTKHVMSYSPKLDPKIVSDRLE